MFVLDDRADRLPRGRRANRGRHRQGPADAVARAARAAHGAPVVGALLLANFGTLCAEFAGLASGGPVADRGRARDRDPGRRLASERLSSAGAFTGSSTYCSRCIAVFVTYVVAGLRWARLSAAAQGTLVPTLPAGPRRGARRSSRTVGTTLAPWGLALHPVLRGRQAPGAEGPPVRARGRGRRGGDRRGDRLLRGRGLCGDPATERRRDRRGERRRPSARAAGGQRRPDLFAIGFLGAAVLRDRDRAAVDRLLVRRVARRYPPISTWLRRGALVLPRLRRDLAPAPLLFALPGVPIVPLLYLSQALNAILLLAILPFIRRLRRADESVIGRPPPRPLARVATAAERSALVAISVGMLLVLTITWATATRRCSPAARRRSGRRAQGAAAADPAAIAPR